MNSIDPSSLGGKQDFNTTSFLSIKSGDTCAYAPDHQTFSMAVQSGRKMQKKRQEELYSDARCTVKTSGDVFREKLKHMQTEPPWNDCDWENGAISRTVALHS